MPPKNKNNGGGCGNNVDVGNPINVGTGNKWQHEVDLTGGTSGLVFDRYYNAGTPANDTYLGSGWLHTYKGSVTVQASGASVLVRRPDGKEYGFQQNAGVWGADADVLDRLDELKNSANSRVGWRYTTANNTVENYDTTGNLTRITDRAGLTLTLTYSCTSISATCPVATPTSITFFAGLLIKVTDNFGKSLNFTYDNGPHIATMTDPAGNITRYSYDANNNLSAVTYPDATPANLTDNPKKTYVYGNGTGERANTADISQANALTGIIDEDGGRYATYQYDANGRAISSEHAGGVGKYSLNYAPDGSSTKVTDPLGSVRTMNFTAILGVVKSIGNDQPGGSGCSAASSKATYDANGNIASRTGFNGHKTCYAYDLARNLETARVEGLPSDADCVSNLVATSLVAPARKISTLWHSDYRLPLQIAGPKQLTRYTYDPSGNVLAHSEQATTDLTGATRLTPTVQGAPRTWTYTYNSLGLMLTADGPRNDVPDLTTYTYYPVTDPNIGNRGNLETIKNALNQTTTVNSYDGNGRPTRVTAANGVTTTLTYTPRGWLKTLAVSGDGPVEATQYGYAPTGLLTTVTQPDLSVLTYGYDAAHRLTSITDSLGNKVTYTLDNTGNRIKERATDPANILRRAITRGYDALGRLQTITGARQ